MNTATPLAAISTRQSSLDPNSEAYLDCLRRLQLCGQTANQVYDPNTGQYHKRVNYCDYDRCGNCHRYKLNRWVSEFSFIHVDFVVELDTEEDIQRFATLWRSYGGKKQAEYCAILKPDSGARLFLRETTGGGLTMQRVQEVMAGVEGAYIKAVDPDGPTLTALIMEAAAHDEAFPFKVKRIRHSRRFFVWGEAEAASECSSEAADETESDGQVRLSSGGGLGSRVNPTEPDDKPKLLIIRWRAATDIAELCWQDRLEDGWMRLDRWGDDDRRWWTLQAPADDRGEYPKSVPLNPRRRK